MHPVPHKGKRSKRPSNSPRSSSAGNGTAEFMRHLYPLLFPIARSVLQVLLIKSQHKQKSRQALPRTFAGHCEEGTRTDLVLLMNRAESIEKEFNDGQVIVPRSHVQTGVSCLWMETKKVSAQKPNKKGLHLRAVRQQPML